MRFLGSLSLPDNEYLSLDGREHTMDPTIPPVVSSNTPTGAGPNMGTSWWDDFLSGLNDPFGMKAAAAKRVWPLVAIVFALLVILLVIWKLIK